MSNLLQQALEELEKYAPVFDGRTHAIECFRTAIEQAEQAQPVYQYRVVGGGWKDCSRTLYEQFSKESITTRVLYTHPQPSTPLSEAPLGAAVLVDGKTVAWFAEFTESANEWCTENYFGQWLAWRAMPPEIVPLTSEELTAVEQRAAELHEFLNIKEQS